jgi:hypothetical protein
VELVFSGCGAGAMEWPDPQPTDMLLAEQLWDVS